MSEANVASTRPSATWPRGVHHSVSSFSIVSVAALGLAAALNPYIGYEAAAEVAKEAYRSGKPVPDVVLEKGILTPDELAERLDPASLTQPRRQAPDDGK